MDGEKTVERRNPRFEWFDLFNNGQRIKAVVDCPFNHGSVSSIPITLLIFLDRTSERTLGSRLPSNAQSRPRHFFASIDLAMPRQNPSATSFNPWRATSFPPTRFPTRSHRTFARIFRRHTVSRFKHRHRSDTEFAPERYRCRPLVPPMRRRCSRRSGSGCDRRIGRTYTGFCCKNASAIESLITISPCVVL